MIIYEGKKISFCINIAIGWLTLTKRLAIGLQKMLYYKLIYLNIDCCINKPYSFL